MPIIQTQSSLKTGSSSITSGTSTYNTSGTSAIYSGTPQYVGTTNNKCQNYNFESFSGLISSFNCIFVIYIVPLIFTISITAFIWGVVQTYLNPTNEEARKKGKSFILWGLVSLFVITAAWGLVKVLSDTFSLDSFRPPLSQ